MLGIILGYLDQAHSNPTVVINPSLVMIGTVNLHGMAEAVVMTDHVAGSETDALTGDMIQRCTKDTAIAMAINDVEEGTSDSLHEYRYVIPTTSPSYH